MSLLLPLFFSTVAAAADLSARRDALLSDQVAEWTDPTRRDAVTASLRRFNPEWDFMHRTFLVLALAETSLEAPSRQAELLPVMDAILADTLAQVEAHGQRWYLMSYVDRMPFLDPSGKSLFVDGEVGLMLGARRLVSQDARWADLHRALNQDMAARFDRSPALLPESYPDEAWLFCVTNALVSMRMGDVLDGKADYTPLIDRWTGQAKARLVETESGMLGSEFTWRGEMHDGPEGSSIWLVATNLLLLDEGFAREQYAAAKAALYHDIAGLGYATEWGRGWKGPQDVDSGPIVPVIDASASSSGFAILAAHAFDDGSALSALSRSLGMAFWAARHAPGFEEIADNEVGNAVIARGLAFGSLWAEVKRRGSAP